MASYLILLGTPRDLYIPYFAMPAPSSRENRVARLNLDAELSKLAGRRCAAWLKVQKDREKIRLVETRNYIPRQTAFYAQWLLFEKEPAFLEFLDALAAELDRRLVRRDFDLSDVGGEQQRRNLARRYVEATDKLHQLDAQFHLLETAKVLGTEWQDKL